MYNIRPIKWFETTHEPYILKSEWTFVGSFMISKTETKYKIFQSPDEGKSDVAYFSTLEACKGWAQDKLKVKLSKHLVVDPWHERMRKKFY